MKILLVNKFYYHRGGDCTATLSAEQLLNAKGHETAVFSVRHPQNLPSPYERYFPKKVDFTSSGLSGKIAAAVRLFRSSEVSRNFNRLLDDFKPDVVHLHNIHSYISPLVAEIARQRGIRTVWTLHDYKLICPSYACRRNGKPCELCFTKKSEVVKHVCMKNSLPGSILAWLEAICWNRERLEKLTGCFISPSNFLKDKMVSAGFNADRIEVLNNFMYKQTLPVADRGDYYCYAGRLSEEKGVDTLLEAASRVPLPLKIIGDGPLLADFKKQYGNSSHIEFMGRMTSEELFPVVQKARFLVIPSVCYENNPYSVIEALCMGTPVLGANIGGIPELIEKGENGMLFEAGNVEELKVRIREMTESSFDCQETAKRAQEKFSAENFYERLMAIYQQPHLLTEKNKRK
jgi:glycosyltransferase involved in cell wall biosynthesis